MKLSVEVRMDTGKWKEMEVNRMLPGDTLEISDDKGLCIVVGIKDDGERRTLSQNILYLWRMQAWPNLKQAILGPSV